MLAWHALLATRPRVLSLWLLHHAILAPQGISATEQLARHALQDSTQLLLGVLNALHVMQGTALQAPDLHQRRRVIGVLRDMKGSCLFHRLRLIASKPGTSTPQHRRGQIRQEMLATLRQVPW